MDFSERQVVVAFAMNMMLCVVLLLMVFNPALNISDFGKALLMMFAIASMGMISAILSLHDHGD